MQAADIRRLFFVLSAAFLIGWAVGNVALLIAVAAVFYTIWVHRKLTALLGWIRDHKHHEAPDPPGVFEDLCREVDHLRERHKKRKKKLGNYLKQFQQATRALPDGTVVLDEHGTVKWANAAAESCLGIRWPEDVNQRITNLIRLPELIAFIEVQETDATIDIASPIDPEVHLNVRLTPYGNRQRLFVARDITLLHRANQIRSDFVANVSHELRTPITVLGGYLENMRSQREQCPSAWVPALEQMTNHTGRMQRLVEELLLLSRLEQDDLTDEPQLVPVPEMIVDIHKHSQESDKVCNRIFALELEMDLTVYGSNQELYSCFSNIIYNAISYTNEHGVIEIHWYHDDDGAHLSVKDNGVGIAAEHLPRLTERFYRVDSSRARSYGGTGLGLAIVKHVLTRHGAALHIESELGKGSMFRCDFPPTAIADNDEGKIDESA